LDEKVLVLRRIAEEICELVLGAKAHDAFDARAVVPGPVEKRHVSRRRHVGDVALEVPLTALCFCRLGQRNGTRMPRVQILHEACDAAALAGAVAPFENDHEPLAALLDVTLQLDEFELERGEFLLVSLALHFPGVRISASSERLLVDLIGKRGIVDIEDGR
jgi:hypothetical protein